MEKLEFDWNDEKNKLLKDQRSVCFEDVVTTMQDNRLLDIVKNSSINHPNQYCLIINILDYAYVVPFIRNESIFFLKTIYKSRKETKKYLKGRI
ncbi:MAG: toxin [Campylobacterota bacterium]|nr:toxin [Campylobacterota bacterium]